MADILPRKRAQAERAELLKRLVDAQERERRRIARELHDQIGQTVTAMALRLRSLEQLAATDRLSPEALREASGSLRSMTGGIGEDIHRAAHDLSPTILDELGLAHALTTLAAEWRLESGPVIDLHFANLERRLPPDVEIAVNRVVQEALTNVVKHARAGVVSVLIERRARELRVIAEDDGQGFDSDNPQSALWGGLSRTDPGLMMVCWSGVR